MKSIKAKNQEFRDKMSKIMKARWAAKRIQNQRQNDLNERKEKASAALRNFSELTGRVAPTVIETPKRVGAVNYCPNCGKHLARFYQL